mmetsp:Transcript_56920/g.132689  ORF Transcript_56920/g.132689 Transcript_56920/m.132689 type:complete len:245 (-) Transcript_56920:162-896(-)
MYPLLHVAIPAEACKELRPLLRQVLGHLLRHVVRHLLRHMVRNMLRHVLGHVLRHLHVRRRLLQHAHPLNGGELLVEAELPKLMQLLVTQMGSLRMQLPVHACSHVGLAPHASEVVLQRALFMEHCCGGSITHKLQGWELLIEAELSELEELLVRERGRFAVQFPVHTLLHVPVSTHALEHIGSLRRHHGHRLKKCELLVETKLAKITQLLVAKLCRLCMQAAMHSCCRVTVTANTSKNVGSAL